MTKIKWIFFIIGIILIILFILLALKTYQSNYIYSNVIPFLTKSKASFLNIQNKTIKPHTFEKGVLSVDGKNISIFIHGKSDFISNHILLYNNWEPYWLKQIIQFSSKHPGIQLLDLGCNLGVYSLVAASFGIKVIAVDANRNNTHRLVQSVVANKLDDKVTIVLNAISNVRKEFSMFIYEPNIGGQFIVDKKTNSYSIQSILLDDLLPLVTNDKEVMIKMDIQGSEISAFKEGSKLFNERNVVAVLIEWIMLKVDKEAYILMNFFLSRNYKAYADFVSVKELDTSNYRAWPYDVVWRKDRFVF